MGETGLIALAAIVAVVAIVALYRGARNVKNIHIGDINAPGGNVATGQGISRTDKRKEAINNWKAVQQKEAAALKAETDRRTEDLKKLPFSIQMARKATVIPTSTKNLFLLTFLPPPLALFGTLFVVRFEGFLGTMGEVLLWAAAALLIPAIYGLAVRPPCLLGRLLLILNAVFLVFLAMEIIALSFPTVEVMIGMSLAIIGLGLADTGPRRVH